MRNDSDNYAFGDFNGDSYFDRLRLEPIMNTTSMKIYFAKGNGKSYTYEKMIGFVEGQCLNESPKLQSIFMTDKGRHILLYAS